MLFRSPGDDVMTYMLKDPEMTDEHHRDNMVVLFIAGHVSFFFFNRLKGRNVHLISWLGNIRG